MNSHRGFGKTWWAERWGGVLESFGWGSRLQRGQTYARQGRVSHLLVEKGVILAKVSGHQSQPYQVEIRLTPLTVSEWSTVIERLRSRPALMAQLLAGEMPRDIDDVFADGGLSLFPTAGWDLRMDCSCPDWANPCKHVAAVYYIFGQRLDENPFLLFAFRGMGQSEMLARLMVHWADDVSEGVDCDEVDEDAEVTKPSIEATAAMLRESAINGTFWLMGPQAANIKLHLTQAHGAPRTLPMVWGPPHFIGPLHPSRARELVSLMADILQSAGMKAQDVIADQGPTEG